MEGLYMGTVWNARGRPLGTDQWDHRQCARAADFIRAPPRPQRHGEAKASLHDPSRRPTTWRFCCGSGKQRNKRHGASAPHPRNPTKCRDKQLCDKCNVDGFFALGFVSVCVSPAPARRTNWQSSSKSNTRKKIPKEPVPPTPQAKQSPDCGNNFDRR
uniref:Uncharacterized protein n=1 Tax=Eutreptiella gymnastica TaxID=73025 RepID=A0A7S4LKT5_9EUGL|mmetsp:Transcript_26604/g.42182  ORF Transcript_26604/g.42182 Transcript_26604/m.42182 type:complete len:158 (-) Transcript_26604:35-508(-)